MNFGIVEDYPFPSSFLLPNRNFTERIAIEDMLYGNALQFRIEGSVFGLIDIAVKPANIRNAPFLPGFGKVAGMDPSPVFPIYFHLFTVMLTEGM